MEKILNLSNLTLEPAPICLDTNIPANKRLYGVTAGQTQRNIAIANDRITGASNYMPFDYVVGYKWKNAGGGWSLASRGNFLMLHIANIPAGATCTAVADYDLYNIQTADADGCVLMYLGDGDARETYQLTLTVTKDDSTIQTKTYTIAVEKEGMLSVSLSDQLSCDLPDSSSSHTQYYVSDLQDNVMVNDYEEPYGITGTVKKLDEYPEVTNDAPCHVLAFCARYPSDAICQLEGTDKGGLTTTLAPFNRTSDEYGWEASYAIPVDNLASIRLTATMGSQSIDQTFGLSGLTLEGGGGAGGTLDFAFDEYAFVYDKNPSEIEDLSGMQITQEETDGTYAVMGTLYNVTDWGTLPLPEEQRSGYFVAFHATDTSGIDSAKVFSSDGTDEYLYDAAVDSQCVVVPIKYTEDGGTKDAACQLLLTTTDSTREFYHFKVDFA